MTTEERLATLKAKINEVNTEGSRLNTVRQQNIGRQQTLEAQLAQSLGAYNKAHGTNLTVEQLDGELNNILANLEKETNEVASVIEAIKNGTYKTDDVQTAPVIAQPQVSQPTVASQPVVAPVVEPTQPVVDVPQPSVVENNVPQAPVVDIPSGSVATNIESPVGLEMPNFNPMPTTTLAFDDDEDDDFAGLGGLAQPSLAVPPTNAVPSQPNNMGSAFAGFSTPPTNPSFAQFKSEFNNN